MKHGARSPAPYTRRPPRRFYFCSCGTEANNAAIWGVVATATAFDPPPHVISSVIEHPAIINYLRFAAERGWLEYDLVPVDHQGLVDPASLTALMRPTTRLVTIMHANNEMGAVQPIDEIARAVKATNPTVLVHTDAAQSFGKVPLDARSVDMATIVGHKIGAPKGIAALYVRRGVHLVPMLHGGGARGGVAGGGRKTSCCRWRWGRRPRRRGQGWRPAQQSSRA